MKIVKTSNLLASYLIAMASYLIEMAFQPGSNGLQRPFAVTFKGIALQKKAQFVTDQ